MFLEGSIKGIVAYNTIKRVYTDSALGSALFYWCFMVFKIRNKYGPRALWVDDIDIPAYMSMSWYLDARGYLVHQRRNKDGTFSTIKFHRFILAPPPDMVVDHKNRDKLDNRRCNLRIVRQGQNCMNSPTRKDNNTGYKGVKKSWNRFIARIRFNGVRYFLGSYATPEEAHAAYCEASKKYHGEFGRTQ